MYKTRMNSYYPQVVQCIKEFQAIIDSEYPEFDMLAEGRDQITADAYLVTMGEERISQWEQLLSIRPIAGSTIDDRRDTVVARIRGQGKLNTQTINAIVKAFTGGTAISYVENSTLYVKITPPPGNKQYQFENVTQELNHKIPAHLGLNVSRNYSTWGEIRDYYRDWNAVAQLPTWDELVLFVVPTD